MARSLRLEFAGAYYHVLARGDRRERIFRDDLDRTFFLSALGEACGQTGWQVHAYVLMGNHYHLCLETPEPNLVAPGMQWLQNAYTRRFNTRHGLWGRVFGDRYKAILVEPGPTEYQLRNELRKPCDYTNTVTHRKMDIHNLRAHLARQWRFAANDLRIKVEAPFSFVSRGADYNCVAYLPDFGTPDGMIIELVCAPHYVPDPVFQSAVEAVGLHCSFISYDFYKQYDEREYKAALRDWGFLGLAELRPPWIDGTDG